MGKSIARVGVDYASTHNPIGGGGSHTNSPYASNSNNVFINGTQAVAVGDSTICGEKAQTGSSTVFINGRPAHCNGNTLDSHANTWTASICIASGAVFAG